MSDTPQPTQGHQHDLDLTEVATFGMSLKRESANVAFPSCLASGAGTLLFGVNGDQITIGFHTRRASSLEPNVWMEGGKMNIPQTEHIIRALITLVAQAKKNEIDKPSPFGIQYSGLPLTTEGE